MYRKTFFPQIKRHSGFGLPMAIFILSVISTLAIAIYRMNAVNARSVAQEVLSARALLAAESGAQVQMMAIFPISGAANCTSIIHTFSVSGLSSCVVNSACNSFVADGETYYEIESTGRCEVGDLSAQRVIQVRAQ